MDGTKRIPLLLTEKNHDSAPGFPGMLRYKTEIELIESEGMASHVHTHDLYPKEYLWYMFPKREQLKITKLEANDVRMIQCAPCQITRFAATFETEQNTLMKKHTHTKEAKVGWTPLQGGLGRYLKVFRDCGSILELDWTRYDGTIPNELFNIVSVFRANCLDVTEHERKQYMAYRKSLLNRLTVVSDGNVYRITRGNPSGQFSTSVDNCMVQTLLIAFETRDWLRSQGEDPTVEEVRAAYRTMSYGDDRLTGYVEGQKYSHMFPPTTEWIVQYYKNKFGMWVKPENVKHTPTVVGASFCGMTIHKLGEQYYPEYNVEKIYANCAHPANPTYDCDALRNKLDSAVILCSASESEMADALRNAARRWGIIDPDYSPVNERLAYELLTGVGRTK
ncbi:RNA-dependent RNA polymerase [Beihai astro-like virus]|uniref:RNA-dependent RNA polymerase n=1 Tax=Beihai astro-like virus TaxID=1922353 RepID=UPI00090B3993|nr:RNA-dependent RNA polymerase [Beihai astro-like virus]APG79032.1 RNA-dependent RNA polymerase [Beihai astro-like virus]